MSKTLLPRDLALIALFAALIAVLGIPGTIALFGSAVPITAQTLGVMLAGSVLGAKRGALAVVTFLVLVAAGLPLLAGGRGGFGVFFAPSGGYLLAFPLGALVIGLIVQRTLPRYRHSVGLLANVVGGMLVIYAVGIPFSAWRLGSADLATIIAALQFVPGDLIKVVFTSLITAGVYRAYPLPAAGMRRGSGGDPAS